MLEWLSDMENTKPLALVIFFVVFVGILLYVLTGKRRGERLESYKHIPFLDDEPEVPQRPADSEESKDA
ncbi:MAG: cbb3-type cytochrome c oxidase subunit 3 [Chromatiaceae bacterium]|jgi:cbb3-type cytochrome oxidase subunit 3